MNTRLLALSLMFMLSFSVSFSQVGIGTETPNPNSALDVESTTQGLLIPRMTEAERLAIPVDPISVGLLVYETDTAEGFWYYDGTVWNQIGTGAAAGTYWELTGDDIYNSNSGNVGIGTDGAATAPLHVKGSTTVATTNENTIYENDFSSGSVTYITGSGNTCTTGTNVWHIETGTSYSCNDCDSGYADITYSFSCVQNQTMIEGPFSSTASSINISFAYYFSGYDSTEKFTITLYNETTGSVSTTLLGPTSTASNTTYTGTHVVIPGDNYSLRFQYVGDNDLGAEVDNILITENLPATPGSYTFRLEDGTQAAGKVLMSDEDGNAYWATPGSADAGSYTDEDWMVDGSNLYNMNTGNVGIGVSVPLYKLHVENDIAGSSVLYSVNTNSSASKSYGIHGVTNAYNHHGAAGVFGESRTAGDREIGVKGDYSVWGAAIAGIGYGMVDTDMATLQDYGVWGAIDYPEGAGVFAWNKNTTASTAFGAYVDGNFAVVTGTKSGSVPTTKGNQLVYSVESPEIWFEDYGTAKLNNGEVYVPLEELFKETIFVDEEHPMHVFLQEEGDSNGLYVIIDEDGNGFTVKEKNGGTSNINFSYTITAKRRFFQDHRFGVDGQQPFENNLAKAKYQEPRSIDPNVVKQKRAQWRAEKNAQVAAAQAENNKKEEENRQKTDKGKKK